MKTLEPAQAFQSGALFNYVGFEGVKPGYVRAMYDFSQDALPRALLQQELFQGTAGTDYSDPFNAPVDKTRVRVLYDRNIAINGHNDEGHWKVKRFYHRNGRRLIYNEKESGDRKDGATEGSHFNTGGRVGDGDLWVVDMFAGIGSPVTPYVSSHRARTIGMKGARLYLSGGVYINECYIFVQPINVCS